MNRNRLLSFYERLIIITRTERLYMCHVREGEGQWMNNNYNYCKNSNNNNY